MSRSRALALLGLIAASGCYSWDKDLAKCVANNKCENPNPDAGGGGGGDDGGTGGGGGGGTGGGVGGGTGGGGAVGGGGGGDDGGFTYGDAGTFAIACLSDGFCWENPFPVGNGFSAVNSFSPGDAWAVGEAGAAVHADTTNDAFTVVTVAASSGAQVDYRLQAVVATPTGVYATDSVGNVLKVDASPVKSAAIFGGAGRGYALWSTPLSTAWLAGNDGASSLVASVDSTSLACTAVTERPGPPLVAFDGDQRAQYAVALDGGAFILTDAGLVPFDVTGIGAPLDVAVVSSDRVFFCGTSGVASITDGGGTVAAAACRAAAVSDPLGFTVSPGQTQLTTYTLAPAAQLRTDPLPFAANDVSAAGDLVVAAGDDGRLATLNTAIHRVTDFSPGTRDTVVDLWVESDGGAVAITSSGQVLKRGAHAWKASNTNAPLTAIEKASDGLYLVGTLDGAGIYEGGVVTPIPLATADGGATPSLKRISANAQGAWAVNGTEHIFTRVPPTQGWTETFSWANTHFNAIWAAPDGPVFAVGSEDVADGGTEVSAWKLTNTGGWNRVTTNGLPGSATDVSGNSSADVWAVGGTGDTFQWMHLAPFISGTQQGPTPMRSLTLTSIGPAEAWVSTGDWHAHFSGGLSGSWQIVPAGISRTPQRLRFQAGALWLVGERGTLLRMPR